MNAGTNKHDNMDQSESSKEDLFIRDPQSRYRNESFNHTLNFETPSVLRSITLLLPPSPWQ